MSKRTPIPENVSKSMRKFYTTHEASTDALKVLDEYVKFLVDHDQIKPLSQEVHDSIHKEMLESLAERKKRTLEMNNVDIYHNYVGTISGSLMRRNLWYEYYG